MNIAELPAAERERIEADKTACLIRYRCKHLAGKERQECARKLLEKSDQSMQEMIKEALKARADSQ